MVDLRYYSSNGLTTIQIYHNKNGNHTTASCIGSNSSDYIPSSPPPPTTTSSSSSLVVPGAPPAEQPTRQSQHKKKKKKDKVDQPEGAICRRNGVDYFLPLTPKERRRRIAKAKKKQQQKAARIDKTRSLRLSSCSTATTTATTTTTTTTATSKEQANIMRVVNDFSFGGCPVPVVVPDDIGRDESLVATSSSCQRPADNGAILLGDDITPASIEGEGQKKKPKKKKTGNSSTTTTTTTTAQTTTNATPAAGIADSIQYAFTSLDGAVESMVAGFFATTAKNGGHEPQASEPDMLLPGGSNSGESIPMIEVDYDGEHDMIYSSTMVDNEPGVVSLVSTSKASDNNNFFWGRGGGAVVSSAGAGKWLANTRQHSRSTMRCQSTMRGTTRRQPTPRNGGSGETTPSSSTTRSRSNTRRSRSASRGQSTGSSLWRRGDYDLKNMPNFRIEQNGEIELEDKNLNNQGDDPAAEAAAAGAKMGFIKRIKCASTKHGGQLQQTSTKSISSTVTATAKRFLFGDDDADKTQRKNKKKPWTTTNSSSSISHVTPDTVPTCEVEARYDDVSSRESQDPAAATAEESPDDHKRETTTTTTKTKTATTDTAPSTKTKSTTSSKSRCKSRSKSRPSSSSRRKKNSSSRSSSSKKKNHHSTTQPSTSAAKKAHSHTVPITVDSQYIHQEEKISVQSDGHNVHTIRMSRIPTKLFLEQGGPKKFLV